MKYFIIILITFFISSCGYGQYPRTKINNKGKIVRYQDTTRPKVYYGIAGIKADSTKYFWRKYIKLKNKGIADSLNPYKSKLKK